MIKASLLESSFATPLIIRQRKRQSSDAQIIINWLGAKDEPYFRNRPKVLAFAYGPSRGLGGDCTMNTDHLWLLRKTPLPASEAFDRGYIHDYFEGNTIKYYDPLSTLKHEVGGHSLGMRHLDGVENKESIMYPYYNKRRKFSKADLAYLTSLYGAASISQKIKNYLRNRIFNF